MVRVSCGTGRSTGDDRPRQGPVAVDVTASEPLLAQAGPALKGQSPSEPSFIRRRHLAGEVRMPSGPLAMAVMSGPRRPCEHLWRFRDEVVGGAGRGSVP